ncbi:uncharacterized protein LOC128558204 [Mercenaria mercenaria]|uniref:uncharacterized protein LOC128558204 n=1 Tax=Mercenaria mercenaria TaxID=6596 RepID=UPI00234E5E59|nr:uncharacterized protein LOC128558204 [Mercenaria mercenaria]
MAAPMKKAGNPLLLKFSTILMISAYLCTMNEPTSDSPTSTMAISFFSNHIPNFSFALRRNLPTSNDSVSARRQQHCLCILLLLLSGDIQTNPGPGNASICPCGVCDIPVTWSQAGVCCDNCGLWFHKTCEEISSRNMSRLNCSNVVWHCCRCNSINIDSFTFNSFELHTSNIFTPLFDTDTTLDSVSSSCFSPLHASSPHTFTTRRRHRPSSTDSTHTNYTPSTSTTSMEHGFPRNQSNLRLLTVNCCSIRTNRSEFAAALDYIKPDLICGTESWLKGVKPGKDPDKNAIKSSEVFPPELTVHRNDRTTGSGGGVFTAAKNKLICDAQPQLTTDCEIVWSKVKTWRSKDLYLCSFYMPHRCKNAIRQLDESIRQLSNSAREKHILLAGDFNCPDIDWPNLTVNKGAADRDVQQALIDLSIEHRLTQIHNQSTRDNNMLDLVFTNNPTTVKTSTSVPGISDHAMVVTDITIIPQVIKQKPRKIYIYSKANWDNIKQDLKTLSETVISEATNQDSTIQTLWDSFKSGIEKTMKANIPSRISKKRKSLPWLSRDLRKMTRRKSRLYKHAKKTNQWGAFKSFQKECKKAFKKAEINHINSTIQKGLDEQNTKPFWRYVKSRRQDSVGVAPLKKMGRLLNNSKDKAQILVDQFRSVFTKDNGDTQLPNTTKRSRTSIPPLRITTKGVEKLLLAINTAKTQGPDMIPNIILKTCAHELAPALTTIFQLSVDTGSLPADWRNANVSPVFKKGDVHLAENYRPVSLTCVTCKLLEHIICKHILAHLENNHILTSLNHGFRSGYSCETQLVTTVHDLLSKTDKGNT